MTPSRQHYSQWNEQEFRDLVPEHADTAVAISKMLEALYRRKRCRNLLFNEDLVVKIDRILQIEKDGEKLLREWLELWAEQDCDDDTQVIERPTDVNRP